MKNLKAMFTIGIALAAATAIYAQEKALQAKVPFNFYMGSTVMPHGDYLITEFNHGMVISMSTEAAHKNITSVSVAGKAADARARLVFHRYGETYFLSEVWTGDSSIGRRLPPTTREKEFAESGVTSALAEIRLAVH